MRPGPSSPSRRGRGRLGSLSSMTVNDLAALLPARMPPLRWLAPRLAVGALLLHLALQLRVLQGFFGCVRACVRAPASLPPRPVYSVPHSQRRP